MKKREEKKRDGKSREKKGNRRGEKRREQNRGLCVIDDEVFGEEGEDSVR